MPKIRQARASAVQGRADKEQPPARATVPPETVDALRSLILERYDDMSGRLKQVARYVLDEPRAIALETLAEIGERCGAQPSAVVRFAQSLGFDGAAPMQRLLRQDLVKNDRPLAYAERVRRYTGADSLKTNDPRQLLHEFSEAVSLATTNLDEAVNPSALIAAVRRIAKAQAVYVVGIRRSFPVASYLGYLLQQSNIRTVMIDGVGGLSAHQASGMDSRDLLIAISFSPYAPETMQVVDKALDAGAAVLAITDSVVSPISKSATVALLIPEPEVRGFRSLSATMCLAQVLGVAVLFETTNAKAGR
jgi:DNA-binding MurR/RpiR family transcriptional regulator